MVIMTHIWLNVNSMRIILIKVILITEPDLRLKMRVQLTNVAGAEEAGVDGGGLFREFLSELLKTAFDPNRGFFQTTNDNLLYPNPNVHLIVEDFTRHYYFIGRVLGKVSHTPAKFVKFLKLRKPQVSF